MYRSRLLMEGSTQTGIPVDELDELWMEQRNRSSELLAAMEKPLGRRAFLRHAARAGGLSLGLPALSALSASCARPSARPPKSPPPQNDVRVVIVGAGLAGLTAAYRLRQAGIPSTVYEAADRVGGRTRTLRRFFSNDETVELCGEYINSDHRAIRALAAELGLSETNLWASYPGNVHGLYWFRGRPYDRQDVNRDFAVVYPAMRRDRLAAGWPTTYNRQTEAGRRLDRMTLAEWIEREVPGGRSSRFGSLVAVGYTGEYGLDPEHQSALNLMFEAGFSRPGDYRLYGYQDWKWRIDGGNDLIATLLVRELPEGTVQLDHALASVRQDPGGVTLSFDVRSAGTKDVRADLAILTLPFTVLRHLDLSGAEFDPLKLRTIEGLGMGTNAKLHFQFSEPVWNDQGLSGDITTDLPIQSTTVVYPIHGSTGILDNYTGGTTGASYRTDTAFGPAPGAAATAALTDLGKIVPGASKAWEGRAYLSFLVVHPWSLGSYSCPRPGEYTTMFGAAKLPQKRILFAGEHTSINYFGFMNGAVESGERVAREVRERLPPEGSSAFQNMLSSRKG